MPQVKITMTKKYKETLDGVPETIRWELEDLETELRRNRLGSGRKPENVHCRSKETLHSYRVNKDWRLITYKWKDDELILLLADKHDDAYRRAHNCRLEWKDGTLNLPIVVEEEPVIVPYAVRKVSVMEPRREVLAEARKPALPDDAKPFADISREKLLRLGVTEEVVDRVRGATYEEIAKGDLVEDLVVGNMLLELAEGTTTCEREMERIETERKRSPIEKALEKHPEMRERYFVLTDELRERFLNGELEDWQVFLHPSQTKAVEIEAAGPVMVSGAAGTGKSVVAFHRVRWLLRQKGFKGKRILFTTYTKTLAQYARTMLAKLCTDEELARVDVVHFDAFLREAWTRGRTLGTGLTRKSEENYGLPTVLRDALEELFGTRRQYVNDRDRAFIAREYLDVILENDIRTEAAYRKLQRPRAFGFLSATMRSRFWAIFSEWNETLSAFSRQKHRPKVAALNTLTNALTAPGANADKDFLLGRYGAVVVDEAQDFGASEYRFLAALTGNAIGHALPTLYLVGDGHQRIYGRSGSFRQCGIDVTNRSITLTKCYRSTKAIRAFAESLLQGLDVTGMDGERVTLDGESLVQGEPPVERYFPKRDYKAENEAIVETIRGWMAQSSKNPGDYAVLLRERRPLKAVVAALNAKGLPAEAIMGNDGFDLTNGRVKVMTMHRAKGLQFVGVVVALDGWPVIPKTVDKADAEAMAANTLSERCLLYMAIMRAQRFVFLTSADGSRAREM